jgi:hypothetical protein
VIPFGSAGGSIEVGNQGNVNDERGYFRNFSELSDDRSRGRGILCQKAAASPRAVARETAGSTHGARHERAGYNKWRAQHDKQCTTHMRDRLHG